MNSICNLKHFKPVFFFLLCSAFFVTGTVFSTLGLASGFIQDKYGFSNVDAAVFLVF